MKRGSDPLSRPVSRQSVLASLIASLLLAPFAAAAEPVFRLGRWTGFVEQSLELNEQQQSATTTARPLFRRTSAVERFSFRNTGTSVGSDVLTMNFGVTLGFEQRRLSAGAGSSQSGDGRLSGYDVTAIVLPRKLFDLTLLANRFENVTPVEYAGNRRVQTSSWGLSMRFGGNAFPGFFRFRSSELESTSEFGSTVRGIGQKEESVSYTGQNRWARQQLHTFLELRDLRDEVVASSSNRSVSANIGHTAELLRPDLVTLRSTVHYFDRDGDLRSVSLHVTEDVRMRHRDNLWTGLQYEFRTQDTFSGLNNESMRGDLWLRHQLWESLETEFRVSKNKTTTASGFSELGESRLRLGYQKLLPAAGRLRSVLTLAYQSRDNLRSDGRELVSQESHTVRFGVPSLLDRLRPIEDSLVVTDALDSNVYEEDIDYEVRFFDEFAEILPLPGGRLVDGQAVLIDYLVEMPTLTKSAAATTNAEVQIDYGWIAPFLTYRSTDDRLLAGVQHSLNQDREDRTAGLRLRKTGRWLRFLAFGEWRAQQSQLQDFDSIRLASNLIYTPGRALSLNANLIHIVNRFDRPGRTVRIDEARVNLNWRPSPPLSIEAFGSDRITRDTDAADQDYARLGVRVRWHLGKFSMISSVERWRRGRDEDNLDGLGVSIRFSRRFFPGVVTLPRRPPAIDPWPEELLGTTTDDEQTIKDGDLIGIGNKEPKSGEEPDENAPPGESS